MRYPHAFSLEGEVALITGGGTGIGKAIAEAFLSAGAKKVVLVARREEVLRAAVRDLGPAAAYAVHDVTDTAATERLVREVEAEHGPLTILVNNAGRTLKKPAEEMTQEEFDLVMDVHVRGAFAMSRCAGRSMLERGKGSMVFIASMASIFALPYVVGYSAAKSAYMGMARTLAAEWSGRGVRVNAIAPGWIRTELLQLTVDADPERKAKVLARTPMKVMGQPEDVGWAAVYLCSPAARFVTGTCLVVDGGISIGF
jgi:NAD(P)-dependent dehydrogenase (short-subunit alcohol dehydrogenase family)